jgi:hypothetical protein
MAKGPWPKGLPLAFITLFYLSLSGEFDNFLCGLSKLAMRELDIVCRRVLPMYNPSGGT